MKILFFLFIFFSIASNVLASERFYDSANRNLNSNAYEGQIDAQYELGEKYLFGSSEYPKNYSKAAFWFEKAAQQGDELAQFNLGWMYQKGQGVKQNNFKSYQWYLKAATKGLSVAQNNLAIMYFNGFGTNVNYKKALIWFKKAASSGYAPAESNLANMYLLGKGGYKDYDKAFSLYKKSAFQGNPVAQYQLGFMFQKGLGTSKNLENAKFWYSKASKKKDQQAIQRLNELNNGMDKSESLISRKMEEAKAFQD
ncbi:hypothetical protein CF386_08525 [Paraphotobacterium marinum]|uniref:Sel1 repeat family protein n=1 Tax=Paraphotobacterium marinum TaxID=1755811 RepID=A0A220VFG5_9GAMM|nr:tetratricopeptide repeat protein [Paraphotobacterium marinum]ASK79105.1 hypothetical protein CF386_08525 [Paraphotobacterium marinum]